MKWEELLPHHRAKLEASAISPAVAEARGYESVGDLKQMAAFGFLGTQQLVPSLLIPVVTPYDQRLPIMIRPDQPPVSDNGRARKYLWQRGQPLRLITHPSCIEHLGDPDSPLWITEGPLKLDALVSAGADAVIGLSGVDGWQGTNGKGGKTELTDWRALTLPARDIYLVFDSDAADHHGVRSAERRLVNWLSLSRQAVVHIVRLPTAGNGTKQGVDDFLAGGGDLDELVGLVVPDADAGEADAKPSQATQLVTMALASYRLGVSSDGVSFAVRGDGPNVALSLRGRGGLRTALAAHYYEVHHKAPGQNPLSEALAVLEGQAAAESGEPVALRMASHEGRLVVDLARPDGKVVLVDPSGWSVVARSPVLFRTNGAIGELPIPVPGGSLDLLKKLITVNDADWPVLVASMVADLMAELAHPVVFFSGEQGTAKTWASKCLVRTFDGSSADVESPPRNAHDWQIVAGASWTVALDNVSKIEDWLADAICRASTGAQSRKRALWTDDDVSVQRIKRVVVLNGIDPVISRGDLAERLLRFELDPITAYVSDERLEDGFAEAHPLILGALLDLASKVIVVLPAIEVPSPPRMASFARVVAAVDQVQGTNGLARYREMVKAQMSAAAEGDLLTQALERFLIPIEDHRWEGAASELLSALRQSESDADRKDLPKSAQTLGTALTRAAPALRADGWTVNRIPGRRHGRRWEVALPTKPDGDPEEEDDIETEGDIYDSAVPSRPQCPPPSPLDEDEDTYHEDARTPGTPEDTCFVDIPFSLFDENSAPPPRDVSIQLGAEDLAVHRYSPDRHHELEAFVSATDIIGLDIESTNAELWTTAFAVRTVTFASDVEAWVIDAESVDAIGRVLGSGRRFVAHNRRFDLLGLSRSLGVDPVDLASAVDDTIILSRLIDPRHRGQGDAAGHALKDLAAALVSPDANRFDETRKTLFRSNKWDWATVPTDHPDFLAYAGSDAILTTRLHRILSALVPDDQAGFELAVDTMLIGLTAKGVALDVERTTTRIEALTTIVDRHIATLATLGVANPNAVRQITAALVAVGVKLPKTAKGADSTTAAVLRPLAAKGVPVAVEVLSYREAKKNLQFLIGLLEAATVDGRIHPDLIGIGTRTHRMSCAAPNLQQLPSGIADIRHAIVADPGNVIISVDYDTIEMRVLAACCGDTNLIEAVSSGDIHAATAAALFGDGFTPAQRSIAKTINFASIYGAGLQRLAAQAGTTPKEMAGHVTQWNKLYPGVRTWLNATADSADQGRVRNAWGRCYPVDPGMGYTGANYIIQSNARMIFAEGLLRIAGAGLGEHLLLPVHDEVLAQAAADEATKVSAALAEVMATTFQGVPITTTPKVGGRSWGSLYETGAGQ